MTYLPTAPSRVVSLTLAATECAAASVMLASVYFNPTYWAQDIRGGAETNAFKIGALVAFPFIATALTRVVFSLDQRDWKKMTRLIPLFYFLPLTLSRIFGVMNSEAAAYLFLAGCTFFIAHCLVAVPFKRPDAILYSNR